MQETTNVIDYVDVNVVGTPMWRVDGAFNYF